MRLLGNLDNQEQAYRFSEYLQNQGIENQLEITTNKDWDSHEYGSVLCRIWVVDEEKFETAQDLFEQFLANPHALQFVYKSEPTQDPQLMETPKQKPAEPPGRITNFILAICTLLLLYGSFTAPAITVKPPDYLPSTPIFSPAINKGLYYDYPKTFELTDQLIKTYGLQEIANQENLPSSATALIQEIKSTPYWEGLYPMIIEHYKNWNTPWVFNAPLFEKISQGEVWRLFTPALLHNDIFHLFFNMVWLLVLGKQLENRLGSLRYLLLIAISALITNTAQYVMSGPSFLGFSGVLCTMLAFVWLRQKKAAWEGYQLERSTITFVLFFILFMFFLQVISFILETHTQSRLPIGIANTAHIIGGIVGLLLARWNFFSWQQR